MENKDIANFIFEMGILREIKHEGWRHLHVAHPESVADHSLRAAQIAFLLAKMEGYEKPEEVCTMVVFHDIAEIRTGDLTRIGKRYVQRNEESAVKDQTANIGAAGKEILDMWKRTDERSTVAGTIAKDADYLEQAFTAREYMEIGHRDTQQWIDNVEKVLKTGSAKKILALLKSTPYNDWWKSLRKLVE